MKHIDLQAIRDRASSVPNGPWHWDGNVDSKQIFLARWTPGRGLCKVMTFCRYGMQHAQPEFWTWHDPTKHEGPIEISKASEVAIKKARLSPTKASEVPVFEVCRDATSRADERVYRGDIDAIRHPVAEFIAHSRQDVDDLLAYIDELEAKLDRDDQITYIRQLEERIEHLRAATGAGRVA